MSQYVKPLTWVLGVVLTLVGVLGFVLTDPLLGIFKIDPIHNIIHLASGLVAIAAVSMSEMYARWYLIAFGLVYGLVTILGFVEGDTVLGIITVNPADNYLHFAIAAVCLIVGFMGEPKSGMMHA